MRLSAAMISCRPRNFPAPDRPTCSGTAARRLRACPAMGARRALLRPACQAGRGRRDGPCGLIDLVVDDRKRALRQLAVVIAVECLHGQGLASRGFANALEIAFRDGEYDANRLYLADV